MAPSGYRGIRHWFWRKRNLLLIPGFAACIWVTSCGDQPAKEAGSNPREAFIPSNEEIFGWIKDITSFGYRRPGEPGSRKTAEYIMNKFREFGLKNVHIEEAKTHAWKADKWRLTVDRKKIPCFFMANTMRVNEFGKYGTGRNSLRAEMVYLGDGTEKDFEKTDVKGKIVVCDIRFYPHTFKDFDGMSYFTYDPNRTVPRDWGHVNPYITKGFPENYYRAQKNGAAGFVGILVEYFNSNKYYTEDYSLSSEYRKFGYMKIPGLFVTKSDGETIKKLFGQAGSDVKKPKAEMVLNVTIRPATAYNVLGYLPGKSKDIMLVHSHHDSVFAGAVEDTSGASIVMALAKYFGSSAGEKRDKTLLFATLDTHFFGYAANKDFISRRKNNGEKIIIDLCAEHIGLEAKVADSTLVTTKHTEPRGIFVTENRNILEIVKKSVIRNNLERMVLIPTYTVLGVVSDSFYIHKTGVPVISMISGPIYLYDIADTPDKVAVKELKPTASAFVDMIEGIDKIPAKDIAKEDFMIFKRISYYWWYLGKVIQFLFS